MDKMYLQRRSHRFTVEEYPLTLPMKRMFQLRDNTMPVGINLHFLAIQHVIVMKKSCFEFTHIAKHVYYIHMKADCNTISFTFHMTAISATLIFKRLVVLTLLVSAHPDNSISK
jgi:hypothetical protein